MGTVVEFKILQTEEAGYGDGVTDGRSARGRGIELTPYLQVGIDDYAKGFRAGFFDQMGLTGTSGNR